MTFCDIIYVYTTLHRGRLVEKRVVVRMPEEMHKKVREKALREGINLSQLIRNWLTQWLEEDPPEENEDP